MAARLDKGIQLRPVGVNSSYAKQRFLRIPRHGRMTCKPVKSDVAFNTSECRTVIEHRNSGCSIMGASELRFYEPGCEIGRIRVGREK
jgi:hypothetical protein